MGMYSFFLAHFVVRPLYGQQNRAIRANLLCSISMYTARIFRFTSNLARADHNCTKVFLLLSLARAYAAFYLQAVKNL